MTFLKVTLRLLSAAAKLYEKFQSKSLMLMITRGHRILCTGINSQGLYFLFKKTDILNQQQVIETQLTLWYTGWTGIRISPKLGQFFFDLCPELWI